MENREKSFVITIIIIIIIILPRTRITRLSNPVNLRLYGVTDAA